MITTYLPWIAVAVGIAAVLSRDGLQRPTEAVPSSKSFSLSAALSLIVLALAACAAAWKWQAASADALPTALGFAAGLLASLASQALGASQFQRGAMLAGPIGFAVALRGLGAMHVPYWFVNHEVGLGLGAAIGAWVITPVGTMKDSDGWPVRMAVFLNAILLTDMLGKMASKETASHAGLFLGVAIAFFSAAVPSTFAIISKGTRGKISWTAGVFCLLLVAAGWLIATRYVWLPDLWKIVAGAILLAIIVNWFLPREPDESALPHLLAAIMWLGLATLSFAFLRGFGMSAALLSAIGVLLFLDNRPALLTLGPLAAMTVYRVFHEMHTSAARALDIGQHYGLVGFIAGAAILGLAIEARRRRPENPIASSAMGLLMMALPVLSAVLIAAKGYVGVLVGLGFAWLIVGSPRLRTALPLAIQMGIGLFMAGAYGSFQSIIDLSRDEKVKALMYAVPAAAILVCIVLFFSRNTSLGGRLRPVDSSHA